MKVDGNSGLSVQQLFCILQISSNAQLEAFARRRSPPETAIEYEYDRNQEINILASGRWRNEPRTFAQSHCAIRILQMSKQSFNIIE
jgi:hypothetical protein